MRAFYEKIAEKSLTGRLSYATLVALVERG